MQTSTFVATALALGVLAGALAFAPPPSAAVHLWLPTSLEASGSPAGVPLAPVSSVSTPTPLAVTASPASISFGPLRPGLASAPVEVVVRNGGALPVRLVPVAAPMLGPSGASIPAEAILVSAQDGGTLPFLAAGASLTLRIQLDTPSGAEQYLPAGGYAGGISLLVEEVGA